MGTAGAMRESRVGSRAGAVLRGLSGVLAGGLVVLLLALAGAWAFGRSDGAPGPGLGTLAWHAVAAVAAVIAQVQADRRPGAPGVWAAVAVLMITAALFTFQWLA